jgi:tRNA nucleotidyltransferase (CCA-adding enzyme)
MRVILTHEQADFDALASLLAASLLDEMAKPILPRKMNRNVRAFVTIYGAELPFIEARDLPSEFIEEVCLVDTQGMVTLKGINSSTRVRVIDHHPQRDDLPTGWVVTTEPTGATVTILIEALQEKNGFTNPIHATLLLLGIYEDTGSLTYSRTTPRDLNAAAYILSQGASLHIARDFLNHPLSPAQQKLYDTLHRNIQTLKIHGHTILLVTGDATNLDEELSTIAHKLRDLLDPDALFMLLTTKSGVQLIARSTSDHIDVGVIAGMFGGGGHDRASAALVKDRDLESIKADLLNILPGYIHPAVTVAQIMSHGLQVLSPEASAHEAADRMQRYGYEGYPVVSQGRIVGLLTRRAVDRALSHKLNIAAASLMNAGCVMVYPDDSIEHLQHVMTESGWGQIPVVEPGTENIIGIVTRTDLLKILTLGIERAGRRNVAGKLEAVLPPTRLVLLRLIAQVASEKRMSLFIVGGFVRDLVLDRPSLDFDLVVEGDAIELANALMRRSGGRVTTHEQFGTAKWYLDGKVTLPNVDTVRLEVGDLPPFLDFITARTEFYTHPTALPTVERGSIKLDLHRRDFTINTLAIRLDDNHFGELHDYWGGVNDLNQKLVRVLHSLSFVDDPTRMLRAVRFEQRFGFKIESRTNELLREAQHLIGRVTGDRLRHELDHIIDEKNAIAMLDRLMELDLLRAIHPHLIWQEWHRLHCERIPFDYPIDDCFTNILEASTPGGWQSLRRLVWYCIWLMTLPLASIEGVCERIHFPRNETMKIIAAGRLWKNIKSFTDYKASQIVAYLEEFPLLAVSVNCLVFQNTEINSLLRTFQTQWRFVRPTFTGNDLRKRGLPPGPIYREIISKVRNAWLDGEVKSAQEEANYLEQILSEIPINGKRTSLGR